MAAASVDPMTEPSNRATRRGTPNSQALPPTTTAVRTTPRVASIRAGPQQIRMFSTRVPKPPANRITARAMLPTS